MFDNAQLWIAKVMALCAVLAAGAGASVPVAQGVDRPMMASVPVASGARHVPAPPQDPPQLIPLPVEPAPQPKPVPLPRPIPVDPPVIKPPYDKCRYHIDQISAAASAEALCPPPCRPVPGPNPVAMYCRPPLD